MTFWIQAGNPSPSFVADAQDESLGEAIETVFPLQTEAAMMVWRHIYVPLSYKYDFGTMVDDLMAVVESVLDTPSGETTVHWPSNTFNAKWTMKWSRGSMNIEATWHCVVGGTEVRLNSAEPVSVSISQFAAEWKRPLQVVASSLERAGYVPDALPGLQRLRDLLGRIPGSGFLYVGVHPVESGVDR